MWRNFHRLPQPRVSTPLAASSPHGAFPGDTGCARLLTAVSAALCGLHWCRDPVSACSRVDAVRTPDTGTVHLTQSIGLTLDQHSGWGGEQSAGVARGWAAYTWLPLLWLMSDAETKFPLV